MRIYDAHNHLQDERFGDRAPQLIAACRLEQVVRMVVNGAAEDDWPAVARLAGDYPEIIPSFGYHPWYIHERTPNWLESLTRFLETAQGAVGEIGLDRWKPGLDYTGQEEVFTAQLRLAAERNLPVSIHCLKAWGRLFELLSGSPRPSCGFLLHSYGGSEEMVPRFAELGAYFSFPGYYAHDRKVRQRQTFQQVPAERLLVETDAPDQPLPERLVLHALSDEQGRGLNHPANLPAIYDQLARVRTQSLESLASQVEENFLRLFGGVCRRLRPDG